MFVQNKLALILTALWLAVFSAAALTPALAQEASDTRAQTGGAQTLEDVLARQRGQTMDDQYRQDATGNSDQAAPRANPLGTLAAFRTLSFGGLCAMAALILPRKIKALPRLRSYKTAACGGCNGALAPCAPMVVSCCWNAFCLAVVLRGPR